MTPGEGRGQVKAAPARHGSARPCAERAEKHRPSPAKCAECPAKSMVYKTQNIAHSLSRPHRGLTCAQLWRVRSTPWRFFGKSFSLPPNGLTTFSPVSVSISQEKTQETGLSYGTQGKRRKNRQKRPHKSRGLSPDVERGERRARTRIAKSASASDRGLCEERPLRDRRRRLVL